MPYVLYLDRYHLGDPLFLTRLARDIKVRPEPVLLVHGAGEGAERALEADGSQPRWRGTVLETKTAEAAETVALAARALNRSIAHALNDAGVAAVRLDGASRGLLAASADGAVRPANAGWLGPLVASGAVPVVAALGGAGSIPRQLPAGAVLAALAEAVGGDVLLLARGDVPAGEATPVAKTAAFLPEPEAASGALAGGARVLVTRARDLGAGTLILARLAQ